MKEIIKLFLIICLISCATKKAQEVVSSQKQYFVIDDFDGNKFIFPIDNTIKICGQDLSFLDRLKPGILAPKAKIRFLDKGSRVLMLLPNSNRHPEIYGTLDSYYTSYVADSILFKVNLVNIQDTQQIIFNIKNSQHILKVFNSNIDSIIMANPN